MPLCRTSAVRTVAWAVLLGLAALLVPAPSQAQQQGPPSSNAARDTSGTRQVDIVASDSLAGTARQRRLIGAVRLRQGTTRLRADRATQYLEQDEILFVGNVLITDEGDSLWADRVRYDSREKVSRATGDVRVSSGGEVLLAGPEGRYLFDEKHAVFPRRVTLVDSARVLKSRSGEYFSRDKRAEFYRDVRVFSDSTYLEADSVTYHRPREVTEARGSVFIERRGDRATSPGEQAARGEGVQGEPARADTARSDTTRSDTTARARRPSLLGRSLPVDTTRRALLPDTTARTLLWGRRAYNAPQLGYSRVTGRALLVRLQPPDSTGTDSSATPPAPRPDTLVVRARRLETKRTPALRRLTATDSVRLWQADLQAVSDSAVYDQRTSDAATRPPRAGLDTMRLETVRPDTARPDTVRSDTARLRSAADTARARAATPAAARAKLPEAPRAPAPRDSARRDSARTDSARRAAPRRRPPPRRESRFFGDPISWSAGMGSNAAAQLRGDSLRVTGRDGMVQRLFARGSAFLAQEDSVLDGRYQQLKGRRITGRFARNAAGETALRTLSAGPNAEMIYFRTKGDTALSGAVRASGDTAIFRVRNGELQKLRVLSGVESVSYRAEDVPTPLQLGGFTWVPARRPRKEAFLKEERVRRRLVRPEPPVPDRREPPPAEPPRAEAAPATAADDSP